MTAYDATRYNASGGKTLDHIPARYHVGVNSITSKYAATTALVAADTINFCTLPAGAVVQEVILSSDGDLGTTFTFDVGDASDVDRFIDGAVMTNATGSIDRLGNVVGSAATGPGYAYTAETDIIGTVVTAAAGTTDATITLTIIFSTEAA